MRTQTKPGGSRKRRSKKEYKERTDSNIPTGPDEGVRVAILQLNIYLIEIKG